MGAEIIVLTSCFFALIFYAFKEIHKNTITKNKEKPIKAIIGSNLKKAKLIPKFSSDKALILSIREMAFI